MKSLQVQGPDVMHMEVIPKTQLQVSANNSITLNISYSSLKKRLFMTIKIIKKKTNETFAVKTAGSKSE